MIAGGLSEEIGRGNRLAPTLFGNSAVLDVPTVWMEIRWDGHNLSSTQPYPHPTTFPLHWYRLPWLMGKGPLYCYPPQLQPRWSKRCFGSRLSKWTAVPLLLLHHCLQVWHSSFRCAVRSQPHAGWVVLWLSAVHRARSRGLHGRCAKSKRVGYCSRGKLLA